MRLHRHQNVCSDVASANDMKCLNQDHSSKTITVNTSSEVGLVLNETHPHKSEYKVGIDEA